MSKKVQIIVAAHKKYRMPEDDIYLPLHVGAEGKIDDKGNPLDLGYAKDNQLLIPHSASSQACTGHGKIVMPTI